MHVTDSEEAKSLQYSPDYVVPPGETLLELLDARGQTPFEFSVMVGLEPTFVARLIVGDERLTEEVAEKIAAVTGISVEFWVRYEAHYRAVQSHKEKDGDLGEDNGAPCPVCTASCTFEAMTWCPMPAPGCPILKRPDSRTYRSENGFPLHFLPAPGYDYQGNPLSEATEETVVRN